MPNKTTNKEAGSGDGFEEIPIRLQEMAASGNTDFLATIAPPVVNEPQTFTDAMLDPTSRSLMTGIASAHISGANLQKTLQDTATELQCTIHDKFVSLNQGSMSYKELLAGLTYEGEIFQTLNKFTFMNYTHLRFSDESGTTISQRSGGTCLMTNKRLLFLSSQNSVGTSLAQWGDPKKLPGGYTLQSSCNDTTYYLPIPLRCLRSVEMSGQTGVQGDVTVRGVAPCCFGWCGLCAFFCCPNSKLLKQWRAQPTIHSQVQEMTVTIGVLMPPWERKMFASIHIDPNVPLNVTRDFVALLQKNSPGLS